MPEPDARNRRTAEQRRARTLRRPDDTQRRAQC